MIEIYLLRHGIAVESDFMSVTKDSERPLTPEGIKKMRCIAKGMKALGLSFECILSSPFLRAKETAEIVARKFHVDEILELTPSLEAGGSPRQLIHDLCRRKGQLTKVLLVGHEPYLSHLASVLVTGKQELPITFKKGGLCLLKAAKLRYGRCATLEWLLTPRQLASIK